MKNLKLVLAAFCISFLSMSSISANETTPKDNNRVLRAKIVNLLGDEIPVVLKKEKNLEVNISFMLNAKNEIVIVSVDAENTVIDSYIKNKLNYKVVQVKGIKKGEIYRVPLKIKQA